MRAKLEEVLEHVRAAGIVRPRDLRRLGIPQNCLWHLHKGGLLERIGRGLYTMPNADVTEHHSLAEVCKRAPRGVICLLSALRFHELTTQSPFEVWVAINVKAREPKLQPLRVRVVRFSGRVLSEGIEERTIEGVKVRVYNAAKTVADCFKYRNKSRQSWDSRVWASDPSPPRPHAENRPRNADARRCQDAERATIRRIAASFASLRLGVFALERTRQLPAGMDRA